MTLTAIRFTTPLSSMWRSGKISANLMSSFIKNTSLPRRRGFFTVCKKLIPNEGIRGNMKQAPAQVSLLSAVVFFIFLIGCASTRAVVEPPVEPVTPAVIDVVPRPPMEPPPGYVKPEIYWVREKIVLTSEVEPPSSTQKVNRGKKSKKTGKRSTE
jgi:hypothetical protein